MAIIPTEKIFFDGKECTDVYYEGHECVEAWYEVDGALECVWRKNTKLQPGDYVFTQSFGTSQGTNYIVYQYNAKTNSISSSESRMIGSNGTAYLFNDTIRNKAMQIIGNYFWKGGDLYFSDDGRNYQKFSERCADIVYLVGNGILTPTPDNQKGTFQSEWLFYEIDDDYNLLSTKNVTMPYTSSNNYDYSLSTNKYFKGGVFAKKYVDTNINDVFFIDTSGNLTFIFRDDRIGDYLSQGHSQVITRTLDIVYDDGIYVALRSSITRTFWYTLSTSQGTIYVYHYLQEIQIITSNNGTTWSTPIVIYSYYGSGSTYGSPSEAIGNIIYDAEKKRFVIYSQISEQQESNSRGTVWYASVYEKGKGITKHSSLPDGYTIGNYYIACVSSATTPSGLTRKNFVINALVDNTYWYKAENYRRKSKFISNLWTTNTAAICMYADNMYLPNATEFKVFNY